MRPSEIEGLQLGDLRKKLIHIKRRVYRGKQGEEGELKSRKGERDVPLAPIQIFGSLMDVLQGDAAASKCYSKGFHVRVGTA